MDFNNFIQTVLGAGAGALAAYVAIRSDLADLKARMVFVEKDVSKSHDRIDNILTK
jgi:hypothetical protein